MDDSTDSNNKKKNNPIKVSYNNENVIPFLNNLTQSPSNKETFPSHINKSNLHDPDLIQHGIDSNGKLPNLNTKLNAKNTRQVDKNTLDYVLKSGFAGGVAGVCAKSLIAPLDRIKILFQTGNPHFLKYRGSMNGLFKAFHHISLVDGVRGFYQGHSATLLRIFPYAGIKFITYEQLRNFFIPSQQYETHIRRLVSGSLAGLSSVFVTYPLDLVRVKMAYITHRKDAQIVPLIKNIYYGSDFVDSKKGIQNFYRGFMPTMYGMIPYAGVAFFAHDAMHDIFKSPLFRDVAVYKQKENGHFLLNTWAELVSGGLAGMLSQTAAYPFEIIRRRLQVTKIAKMNCLSMAKLIYKEQGVKSFYVGLSIGYIKVMPMVACSFYVYEQMKWLLHI
ncbi:coenzyme A transporter [Hanseniaspora uvarum]|nr:coenzyme A transporter [Hanseniaspora uvarum]